jgi:hypothetical protein
VNSQQPSPKIKYLVHHQGRIEGPFDVDFIEAMVLAGVYPQDIQIQESHKNVFTTFSRVRGNSSMPQLPPPLKERAPVAPPARKGKWWTSLIYIIFWDIRLTIAGGFLIWYLVSETIKENAPKRQYVSTAPSSQTRKIPSPTRQLNPKKLSYVRPTTAPNGAYWPSIASYISGYDVLATGGNSPVTIDNSKNSSDVFLKLVSLNNATAYPVRACYIPAYSKFTFENVLPGSYDVRYQDLSMGGFSKTEEFNLTETRTISGIEFSTLTLTLYKVQHGNMHTSAIDESDF